jgi:hypothetical protein
MIEIKTSSSPDVKARVIFGQTKSFGRIVYNYIEAKKINDEYENPAYVNIPATGDMQLEDIPEFIKAVELAVMIASGELEID